MSLKFNRQALGLKIQSTLGTAAPPAFATDAVRIAALTAQPYVVDQVQAPEILDSLDAPRSMPYKPRATFAITVNAFASGTAGTAPAWGAFMRMCGMSQTITAGTKVEYAYANTAFERATIDHHLDAIRHRSIDVIGSLDWAWNAGAVPQFTANCEGTDAIPTDQSFPSPVLTSWFDPIVISKDNTAATIGGYTACISQFSGSSGGTITTFDRINCKASELTARNKTGTIVFEMTTVAAKNWFNSLKNRTTEAIVVTHGTGAGNVLKMTISDAKFTDMQYQDDAGITMVSAPFDFRSLVISSE